MFKNKGFTMIELLVSIAIFALILFIAIPNFRGSETQEQLYGSARDLASIIRKYQFLASTGRTVNYQGQNILPQGGYGLYITECTGTPCPIKLFADMDGQLDYDGVDEQVFEKEFNLTGRVWISDISISSPLTVLFKPPVPYICINKDCSNIGKVEITLTNSNNSTKKVIINQNTSQVSVE